MRARFALAIAALAIVVAAIVVHERSETPGAAPARNVRAVADGPTRAAPAKRARPAPVLAMPAPAVGETAVPQACATGTSGSDAWWACLPRTPEWDANRARYLVDRLAQRIDVHLAADRIECRTRCCRVLISRAEYREHGDELSSAVGMRIGPTDGYGAQPTQRGVPDSDIAITTCWKPGPIDAFPDRAVERDQLLADAANDLAACARDVAQPTSLQLLLQLDEDGTVDMIEPEDGNTPRPCVDAALRNAASFAPAPDTMTRSVPLRIVLTPPS